MAVAKEDKLAMRTVMVGESPTLRHHYIRPQLQILIQWRSQKLGAQLRQMGCIGKADEEVLRGIAAAGVGDGAVDVDF